MNNETCPWCGAKKEHSSPEDVVKVFACASLGTFFIGEERQSEICKARCKDQLIEKQQKRIEELEEEQVAESTRECRMLCMRVEDKNQLIEKQGKEIKRLEKWVDDCQSGMWINCVYCGHRYGPNTEASSMREVLRRHVECCPKHPMSEIRDVIINFLKWENYEKHTEREWLEALEKLAVTTNYTNENSIL